MKQPLLIHSVAEWRALRRSETFDNKKVGFVPTMGALHEGHASLMKRARQENDLAILSIFVNPTQFNQSSDLEKYPRTLEADIALAMQERVDYILFPTAEEIYADEYRYQVVENKLSKELEGEYRPGHFSGMLTVVLKLLLIVRATYAYFGEKDFQQLELVRGMVDAFFIETEIVPCATVRAQDGLALSSRNSRLTPEQREKGALFPKLLSSQLSLGEIKTQLETAGFKVDYIEERYGRRLGAVYLGEIRLIDNFEL